MRRTASASVLLAFVAGGLAACSEAPGTIVYRGREVHRAEVPRCEDGGACAASFVIEGDLYLRGGCGEAPPRSGHVYAVTDRSEPLTIHGEPPRLALKVDDDPECEWLPLERAPGSR